MYLLVYVDDILITGSSPEAILELITKLQHKFTIKHLGQAHHFLGIKIQSFKDKYFLSQRTYAESILIQSNLLSCNPVANPSSTKVQSSVPQDSHLSDASTYRRIIGSLQYLTITRPDIAYAVNSLSQHMQNPSQYDAHNLKRLLRYIKGTLTFGLPISKAQLSLQTFSDADWAGDPDTRQSTSGYCTFLGDTLISWAVKKQNTIARSSMELKYRALALATADTIWLKRLLQDFHIPHNQPIKLFCDNTSAIALALNLVFHARTKHIEIDQRFV
ncbi:hypothetical protein KFK09_019185 [Dendrobium nobile]|uniref:Reverse transcriptase Ty1/copia-type domain-containing protein n=1 Tax=Dendrobium nobile TaxID=94219 RepID=A0A8T3AXV7_DENNO|nr:hypothetical protein KFK09_019185 [Dendrobium nobile]